MKKLIIIVLVIIIGPLLGYWIYDSYVAPSPSEKFIKNSEQEEKEEEPVAIEEVTDWKIYKDDNNKFQISYPADWSMKDEGLNGITFKSSDFQGTDLGGVEVLGLQGGKFSIKKSPLSSKNQKSLEELIKGNDMFGRDKSEDKEIEVDGVQAIYIRGEYSEGLFGLRVAFTHLESYTGYGGGEYAGYYDYYISLVFNDNNKQVDYLKVFDKIVSSFKFIN